MARVKLCKNCKTINPSNQASCENCGKDLKGRPISEEEAKKEIEKMEKKEQEEELGATAEAAQEPASQEPAGVRVLTHYYQCDCGHQNPITISICERCGESLDGLMIMTAPTSAAAAAPVVAPTPAAAPMPELGQRVRLLSHDKVFQLKVTGRMVLGADNEGSEYFYHKNYVGGCHAAIIAEADGVYLEDMNSRNGTYVNGTKITPGQRVRLENGAEICLGGPEKNGLRQKSAYLTVEIGV